MAAVQNRGYDPVDFHVPVQGTIRRAVRFSAVKAPNHGHVPACGLATGSVPVPEADVAELADATDLGSVARQGVEVRVLSSAPGDTGPWPSGKAPPLQGGDRRFESDRVHLVVFVGVVLHAHMQPQFVPQGAGSSQRLLCGRGSVVEHLLAKERVVGSNPIARSRMPRQVGGLAV